MKKIAILGRGTAGVYTATHFLKYTDCELDLYFDSSIKPSAVGEGSTLDFPMELYKNVDFDCTDLELIHGTVKQGIKKINWGKANEEFFHSFYPPNSVGYHFNAVEFQNLIIEKIKYNKRVNFIDKNIVSHNDIDSNFIVDCTGKPKSMDGIIESEYIPVNSVHVEQCYWQGAKFLYTYAIARPYGWVFAIPLLNRCSVGYLYNNKINTLDEVKEDIKNVINLLGLPPPTTTNNFTFSNYYRKENYSDRVFYNGNASFFLEPLEATSIFSMNKVSRWGYDVFFDNIQTNTLNSRYIELFQKLEDMINLHYFAGSSFDTDFWKMAKDKAERCFVRSSSNPLRKQELLNYISSYDSSYEKSLQTKEEYGVWPKASFNQNLNGLNIGKELFEFIEKI